MFFSTGILALLVSGLVTGTPLPPSDKAFTIKQKAVDGIVRPRGAAALARSYAKYGIDVSEELAAAVMKHKRHEPKGSTSTTGAEFLSDSQYYISPVQIGTPPKTFNLEIDTGSYTTWLISTLQPADQQVGHNVYDPANSTTSKLLKGYTFADNYGDGSYANGKVYDDTVSIGAVSTTMGLGAVVDCSDFYWEDPRSDGIMGMGVPGDNATQPHSTKNFFASVKDQLKAPLFTADLNYYTPGSFDFGYIDSSKYNGSLSYVPANVSYMALNHPYWGLTVSGLGLPCNSKESTAVETVKINAILDTGSSFINLPQTYLERYYKDVVNATYSTDDGGWIFPCSSTLPDLYIRVGEYTADVLGSTLNDGQIDPINCFGNLQPLPPGQPFQAVVGIPFLQRSFSVFEYPDSEPPTIGFGHKSLR